MEILFCSCYERPCIIIYLYDKPTWSRQKWCLNLFLGLCKFYQLRMWETGISGLELVALIRLLTTHWIYKGFTSRMKCTIWTQHAWEDTPTFLFLKLSNVTKKWRLLAKGKNNDTFYYYISCLRCRMIS